jgi:putative phosphoesterase
MKIGVFSDMHGNAVALDAVLKDMEKDRVDRVVCLGDAVQGGAEPAETVARLRELGCPVVMGNADAWMLTGVSTSPGEQVSEEMERVRQWSLANLSDEDKEFIRGFQPTVEIELEAGRKLLCFHGSPSSFDELIFPETPEEEVQRMLAGWQEYITCGGHTHLQQIRRTGEYFFFNPGSVGLAFNRKQEPENFRIDPWAEYAILTSEGEKIGLEFRRVPISVAEVVRTFKESGRPNMERALAQYGE